MVRQSQRRWREKHPDQYRQKTREANLRRKYRLSAAAYAAMFEAQAGLCAIRARPETRTTENGAVAPLSVDHCHARSTADSIVVRALLCDRCNKVLGFVSDDATLLRAALAYLQRRGALAA